MSSICCCATAGAVRIETIASVAGNQRTRESGRRVIVEDLEVFWVLIRGNEPFAGTPASGVKSPSVTAKAANVARRSHSPLVGGNVPAHVAYKLHRPAFRSRPVRSPAAGR